MLSHGSPIHQDDRHKSAFHSRTHKFECACMRFGLMNAPVELQRQVNHGSSGPMDEGWMVVFMDDVIAFGQTVQEPVQRLKKALQPFLGKQWYVKGRKCSFTCKQFVF